MPATVVIRKIAFEFPIHEDEGAVMTPRAERHACRRLTQMAWKCAVRGLILCLMVFSPHVASGQHVSLPPVNLGGTNF